MPNVKQAYRMGEYVSLMEVQAMWRWAYRTLHTGPRLPRWLNEGATRCLYLMISGSQGRLVDINTLRGRL